MNQMIKVCIAVVIAAVMLVKSKYDDKQARLAMVSTYHLTKAETAAYDSCQSALYKKQLRNGGDKASFCGCFAKKATARFNDRHKAVAASFMSQMVGKDARGALALLTPDTFADRSDNILAVSSSVTDGFTTCVADVNPTCAQSDTACMSRLTNRLAQR